MDDPLNDLLRPTCDAPSETLREDLLTRTTKTLRWRRRARQLGGIGVLVAAYVAGLLTVAAWTPLEEPVPQPVIAREPCAKPLTPVALEWRALEEPEAAARWYVQAADGYLGEGDPENAVRCYGHALAESGPSGLEVSTNDSWLFLAIKLARKKESE